MSQQEQEYQEAMQQYILPLLTDQSVCSMDDFVQHGTTSTLQHCISVMRASCALAAKFHLKVNYRALAVGALLHDFYLYDWHGHKSEGGLPHGFTHPLVACYNAVERFGIPPEVQHIIVTHMWPLTLRAVPRSREAVIVCLVDKYCSSLETLAGMWHFARTHGFRREI